MQFYWSIIAQPCQVSSQKTTALFTCHIARKADCWSVLCKRMHQRSPLKFVEAICVSYEIFCLDDIFQLVRFICCFIVLNYLLNIFIDELRWTRTCGKQQFVRAMCSMQSSSLLSVDRVRLRSLIIKYVFLTRVQY